MYVRLFSVVFTTIYKSKTEQIQKLQRKLSWKDTTFVTLSWFLYELCKLPHVQEKIAQEIREATNVTAGSIIDEHRIRVTEENMEKMKYCFSDDAWPNGFSVRKCDFVSFKVYGVGRMKMEF
ncbi:hypothetical protein VNO80_16689 [Phaseolus coccineus]|uniref:Uncharacterized protein n=1 Tax=Phaseolus coccineus TaxID=3886 RepID=A0AAN9MMN7_PHACN